jgi:hypothetical protein
MHLGFQGFAEIFKPARHIHAVISDGLERLVKILSISIVVFADGEKFLKVVPGAVEAQSGQEPGSSAVSIYKRMDVDKLKLRYSSSKNGRDCTFVFQPILQNLKS